jgi:hypothetical protein
LPGPGKACIGTLACAAHARPEPECKLPLYARDTTHAAVCRIVQRAGWCSMPLWGTKWWQQSRTGRKDEAVCTTQRSIKASAIRHMVIISLLLNYGDAGEYGTGWQMPRPKHSSRALSTTACSPRAAMSSAGPSQPPKITEAGQPGPGSYNTDALHRTGRRITWLGPASRSAFKSVQRKLDLAGNPAAPPPGAYDLGRVSAQARECDHAWSACSR